MLRREDAFEGARKNWQTLVAKARVARVIRFVGIYASPLVTADD